MPTVICCHNHRYVYKCVTIAYHNDWIHVYKTKDNCIKIIHTAKLMIVCSSFWNQISVVVAVVFIGCENLHILAVKLIIEYDVASYYWHWSGVNNGSHTLVWPWPSWICDLPQGQIHVCKQQLLSAFSDSGNV